jgi:hypothetical protein
MSARPFGDQWGLTDTIAAGLLLIALTLVIAWGWT